MDDNCTDRSTGRLIHAYELGLLSDEESERFELHLMQCEYCVSQIESSAFKSDWLRSDRQIRNELQNLARHPTGEVRWPEKLRGYLWPKVPLPLRPALLLLLVLLLIYPAYRGLRQQDSGEIISLTEIGLVQSRGASAEAATLSAGKSAVLTFAYSRFQPGAEVTVQIVDESGRVVYENSAFDGFDRFQTARLLLPGDLLQPGEYRLQVGPAGVTADEIEQYRFRIVR